MRDSNISRGFQPQQVFSSYFPYEGLKRITQGISLQPRMSYLPYEGFKRKPPFPIFGEGGFPASACPGRARRTPQKTFARFQKVLSYWRYDVPGQLREDRDTAALLQ